MKEKDRRPQVSAFPSSFKRPLLPLLFSMGVSLFAPRSLPLTTVISTRISMPPQRQPQPNRPRWKQDKRKGARAHDPPPSSSRLPPNPKRSYSTASNASIDASTSTTLPRGTTLMTYNVEGLRKITNETNGPVRPSSSLSSSV